jgi:HK97 family phage portal protein
MGLFDKLERSGLRADQGALPFDDPRLWTPTGSWDYSDTLAGVGITPESAKRCAAVFACNSLIAETLASLPCILYKRRADGGKERARDHRAYRTVRLRPNGWMTPMEFFTGGQMSAGMRGNAMAKILDDGKTIELQPMHASRVTIEQLTSTRMRYQYNNPFTGPETLLQDQVLHVRDLSDDGFIGQARAVLAREAIAVAQAAEAFVGGFFRNNATGRLVLSSPTSPDETKRAEYRRMVAENYAGWRNASNTMFLWGGLQHEELGKQNDSEFLITPRNYQVAEIARFWRVPLFMIGLEEKSTTWGTGVEQQVQGFVDFTEKPWLDRWAQALGRSLLDESEQEDYFFEFLLNDLVRGDLKTRMEAYQIGRQIGMYSPNDLLKKENENPRDDAGGEEYQQTPTGAAPNAPNAPAEGRRPAEPQPATTSAADTPVIKGTDQAAPAAPTPPAIPTPLLADAVTRIASRELADVGRRLARGGEVEKVTAWLAKYYAGHRDYVVKVLAPLGEAFGIEAWVLEEVGERIERTGCAAAVLADFQTRRRDAIAELLEETLTVGAIARQE